MDAEHLTDILAALERASDALNELCGPLSGYGETPEARLIEQTGNDDHAGLFAAIDAAIGIVQREAERRGR